MPPRYSKDVEDIFRSWLESLENPDDPKKAIDPEVIRGLKILIDNGKINSAAAIKHLMDEVGGKHAA